MQFSLRTIWTKTSQTWLVRYIINKGSIFSELKNHINKQSKFENNTEIKKILERTKKNGLLLLI
jgi:hypothetical protein